LLYRGSEQKFTNASFIRYVGNQGPTLHIIKSEHNYLFGGCAFEKYPYNNGSYKKDAKAFLFQLHPKQEKLKNKNENNFDAIRCSDQCLSLFGFDMEISSNKPDEVD
jgi:hypothetical protein